MLKSQVWSNMLVWNSKLFSVGLNLVLPIKLTSMQKVIRGYAGDQDKPLLISLHPPIL